MPSTINAEGNIGKAGLLEGIVKWPLGPEGAVVDYFVKWSDVTLLRLKGYRQCFAKI